MGKQFKGRTENAGAAILGAQFWKPGTKVYGTFIRKWESSVGEMLDFNVIQGQPKPTAFLDEKGRVTDSKTPGAKEIQLEKFTMGGLKGFLMALADLEGQGYKMQFRDQLEIICTGIQETDDQNKDNMSLFEVNVI